MAIVKFHSVDVNPALTQKTKLKQFVTFICSSEGKKLKKIDFIFCSDEYLLALNKQFLQHDYYTDILTFNLSKDTSGIIGEIYISTDRVQENAVNNNTDYLQEIRRVIFHGVLHLCGYLDQYESDKNFMTEKENHYLAQFDMFHVESR